MRASMPFLRRVSRNGEEETAAMLSPAVLADSVQVGVVHFRKDMRIVCK